MRLISAFRSFGITCVLLSLCLAIAVGNAPRAFLLGQASLGSSYHGCYLGAAEVPISSTSGQEEQPTEAPPASELLQLGESASLSEARRVIRRAVGMRRFLTHARRTVTIVNTTRRDSRHATCEQSFRNGLGAPIRC